MNVRAPTRWPSSNLTLPVRLYQQSDLYCANPHAQYARTTQSCAPGNLWQRPCQLYDRLAGAPSEPHAQPERGDLQAAAAARGSRAHTRRTMGAARRALLPLRHARPLLRACRARRGERRTDDHGAAEESAADLVGLESSFADVSTRTGLGGGETRSCHVSERFVVAVVFVGESTPLTPLTSLSTGPHWELSRLTPITEQEMVLAYSIMVHTAVPPLFFRQKGSDLSIVE